MPYGGTDLYCVKVGNVNFINLLPTPGAISAWKYWLTQINQTYICKTALA